MPKRFVNFTLFLTFSVYFSAASFSAQLLAIQAEPLKAGPVVKSKSSPVLTDKVKSFLVVRDGDKAKVWVFFTDKQIQTKSAFDQKAAALTLGDKLLKRRAKVNLDHVLFADLPVPENYIKNIVDLGAIHRRTSNWQNAASFEVPTDKLSQIASLPFVAEIRPVAFYKHEPLPELGKDSFPNQRQSPDALNYGNSASQLAQIKVDKLHQLGYHGEGVILAILDTGFRKSHQAFAAHYADNRVLAEHDFIFNDGNTANEPGDSANQWNHGTYIWSVSGGMHDGDIYGPAYEASFVLAKTEDIRSETPIEEDNWVAAVEWADTYGADVLTSSLGYIDWYTQAQLDGATAVTTIEANMAASMGIVLCNAAGNEGPNGPSLIAPADAFNILAVGAVTGSGALASFSSRGPTADGRTKPEVCARGVSTWAATANSDASYGSASGTSLSTPLVAGAACLLVQAHPGFTPQLIRQAMMETASNAAAPNNSLGWGIINAEAALGWGAEFTADITTSNAPHTVNFTANTSVTATSWDWSFGDGGTSTQQNPAHQYLLPGVYDVSLTIQSAYGQISNLKDNYIAMYGDTVRIESDSALAGRQVVISVALINSQPLLSMIIPFRYGSTPAAILDSATRGSRTNYFEQMNVVGIDFTNRRYGYQLIANSGGGAPPLAIGSGEVLKLYLTIDSLALGSQTAVIDTTTFLSNKLQLTATAVSYTPALFTGAIATKAIRRGDANYDRALNIIDLTYLVNYVFRGGVKPITIQSGDLNSDFHVNVEDLSYIVEYMFRGGPPPATP